MWPNLISVGSYHLATYGVCVAAAYLTAIYWLKSQMENMGLDEKKFWTLIYCLFFGAIAGGKILYVIVEWHSFVSGQLRLFRDFRYGFVFYGGFLGAMLMGALYARLTGVGFLRIADYFGVALPMGHWLGRLGCLAAGCCYGRPTRLPWGIRFTDSYSLVPESLLGVPLHPTQLYEAIGHIAMGIFLYRLLQRVLKEKFRTGTVFFAYVLLYAALRFFVEIFRGDDRGGFWLGLSPSQRIALACVAVAGPLLWHRGIWTKNSA